MLPEPSSYIGSGPDYASYIQAGTQAGIQPFAIYNAAQATVAQRQQQQAALEALQQKNALNATLAPGDIEEQRLKLQGLRQLYAPIPSLDGPSAGIPLTAPTPTPGDSTGTVSNVIPNGDGTFGATATVFGGSKDLNAYNAAKASGATEIQALAAGDNGIGAWGANTADPTKKYVAVSPDFMAANNLKPGDPITVNANGKSSLAYVGDKLPNNSKNGTGIDLNPGVASDLGVDPNNFKGAVTFKIGHDSANTGPISVSQDGGALNRAIATAQALPGAIPPIGNLVDPRGQQLLNAAVASGKDDPANGIFLNQSGSSVPGANLGNLASIGATTPNDTAFLSSGITPMPSPFAQSDPFHPAIQSALSVANQTAGIAPLASNALAQKAMDAHATMSIPTGDSITGQGILDTGYFADPVHKTGWTHIDPSQRNLIPPGTSFGTHRVIPIAQQAEAAKMQIAQREAAAAQQLAQDSSPIVVSADSSNAPGAIPGHILAPRYVSTLKDGYPLQAENPTLSSSLNVANTHGVPTDAHEVIVNGRPYIDTTSLGHATGKAAQGLEFQRIDSAFKAAPTVAPFLTVAGNNASIQDNVAIPPAQRTAADDDALMKSVAGVENPGGKPGEGELNSVAKTAGFRDEYNTIINNLGNKKRILSDEQVANLGAVAQRKVNSLKPSFQAQLDTMTAQAQAAGLDASDVFGKSMNYYNSLGVPKANSGGGKPLDSATLSNAKAAIVTKGRSAVMQRLQQAGYDTSGL